MTATIGVLIYVFGIFSAIVFYYFCLRNSEPQQQIVLQEVERDEVPHLDGDCEAELFQSDEANKIWQDVINDLLASEISQNQLLAEYSKTLIAMWDKIDPFYAEELAMEPFSEVLRMGNRSRKYSFRRFVKSLGK